MKPMIFLFNPRSGREQIKNQLSGILDCFCKNGYFPSVYVTQNAKDAERLTNLDDSTLQVPSPHNEVEQFLQRTEQQEQLAQLLQGLSETDRTILFLRCEQEQSFREIAERLSMKEATVRKRFERARKAIQKQEERGISYVKKCSIQP